ncbi:MAG: hypothetical protein GY729_08460 [Desulfobacteraceae bacterium]|nr:hypothetical protein [Desulfobacteraceae bacterium]
MIDISDTDQKKQVKIMRKSLLSILLLVFITISASTGFAEETMEVINENGWEKELVSALMEVNAAQAKDRTYSGEASADSILMPLLVTALKNNAPPWAVARVAVELNFNPYVVVKTVFENSEKIDLKQFFAVSIASGISKQIVAKAAVDAKSFSKDTVFKKSQLVEAMKEQDLGFTITTADTIVLENDNTERSDDIIQDSGDKLLTSNKDVIQGSGDILLSSNNDVIQDGNTQFSEATDTPPSNVTLISDVIPIGTTDTDYIQPILNSVPEGQVDDNSNQQQGLGYTVTADNQPPRITPPAKGDPFSKSVPG